MRIDLDTSMYGTLNDLWAVEEYSEAGQQLEFTTVTDMVQSGDVPFAALRFKLNVYVHIYVWTTDRITSFSDCCSLCNICSFYKNLTSKIHKLLHTTQTHNTCWYVLLTVSFYQEF